MRSKRHICLAAIFVFVAINPNTLRFARAADISVNTTITTPNTNVQQNIDTNNVTLTINADTTGRTNNGVQLDGITGATVIIGSGVTVSVTNNQAIDATNSTNATITNSGTISAAAAKTIEFEATAGNVTSGATVNNNLGGTITGATNTIKTNLRTTNTTINNSGLISVTGTGRAIGPGTGRDTGTVINNNSTGVIVKTSTADNDGEVLELGDSGTITNSGQIRNDTSPSNSAINLKGDNNTLILRDKGIVVGKIVSEGTGNKLQLQHGFGRAYFYETSGVLTLEDLSGNVVVKGSAGSVALGAQETVDELLGLRTSNLRAALKRHAASPKLSGTGIIWGETFGYRSKRQGTSNLLKYETNAWGLNFIQPITTNLDLVLSLETNKLSLQEDHDVTRKGFFSGLSVSEYPVFGRYKFTAGGFALGGVGWYDSRRQVLTNTTTSGLLDLNANFKSFELITGGNIGYNFELPKRASAKNSLQNKLDTELGFTLGGSHTGDYNEGTLFFWEDRRLLQESLYLQEQFSYELDERTGIKLGVEIEHRKVLNGKEQEYKVKETRVVSSEGRNFENSISGNLDFNYKTPYGLAYFQLQHRISDQSRGTLGGGIGVKFRF